MPSNHLILCRSLLPLPSIFPRIRVFLMSQLIALGGQSIRASASVLPMNVLRCAQSLSCVQVFATPWTVAYQAPLSMKFSRQEYQSGLPFPSPGDLPDPGIEPESLHCRQTLYSLSYQGNPNKESGGSEIVGNLQSSLFDLPLVLFIVPKKTSMFFKQHIA